MRAGRHARWEGSVQKRQRPGDETRLDQYGNTIVKCIQTCENVKRCSDSRCVCSASDNDALIGCIRYDCGDTAANNYREDLIAECPRALDYGRRPGEDVPARSPTTSARITFTPKPAPPPAPKPATTSTSTRSTTTRTTARTPPAPRPTTSSAVVRQPAPSAIPPPLNTPVAASSLILIPSVIPADEVASVVESRSETLSSILPSEIAAESQLPDPSMSTTLSDTVTLSLSQNDVLPLGAGQIEDESDAVTLPISLESEYYPVLVTSDEIPQSTQGSKARPPLDPSSPGAVSKLNSGVIAGIVIAILAVMGLFLAIWYRSHRRRKQNERGCIHISSPAFSQSSYDDPSGSASWTQFGGAKGSMISSFDDSGTEKNAPIYSKFAAARQAVPSSAIMASRRQSVSTAGISRTNSKRSSSRAVLSSMKSRWLDAASPNTPPPSYPTQSADGLAVPAPIYKRPAGTSFFARLLSNPIERQPIQAAQSAPKLPYPHFNSPQSPESPRQLEPLPEEERDENRDSEDLNARAERNSHFSGDDSHWDGLQAPKASPMRQIRTPADSIYEGDKSGLSHGRPSFAWSARSLPRAMSVSEDAAEDGPPQIAASTRAPSLDLAWVTQETNRIPVPSWAVLPQLRRPSVKSKKSSRSTNHRSTNRHSFMSSRSSRTFPSRSAHSSTGPIPDVPSLSSVPSFRIEIGADRAKAILSLLVNTPTTPSVDEQAAHAQTKTTDFCGDESRPVSVCHDEPHTSNYRDSIQSS